MSREGLASKGSRPRLGVATRPEARQGDRFRDQARRARSPGAQRTTARSDAQCPPMTWALCARPSTATRTVHMAQSWVWVTVLVYCSWTLFIKKKNDPLVLVYHKETQSYFLQV